VGRNVAALVDSPKGQQAGRPSKSLTLEQCCPSFKMSTAASSGLSMCWQ
jgi:hypothetical protein